MKRVIAFFAGALLAVSLGVFAQQSTVSGSPSRPRFQAVGVNTAAPSTVGQITQSGTTTVFRQIATGGAANTQRWLAQTNGANWYLTAMNDAEGVGSDAITINRTTTTINSINLAATALQWNGVAQGNIIDGVAGGCALSTTLAVGQSFICVKPSDESRSSTATESNDAQLVISGLSGTAQYIVDGLFVFHSSSATPDARMAIAVSGGSGFSSFGRTSCAGVFTGVDWVNGAVTVIDMSGSNECAMPLTGRFQSQTQINFQWAQGTSNGTATTLRTGSYMRVTRVL